MENPKKLMSILAAMALITASAVPLARAADTGSTETMARIKRAVGEIRSVDEALADLSNRIANTGAVVAALTDTFDKTGDPTLVVDELSRAEAILEDINAELSETSARLAAVRLELNEIRGMNLSKSAASALRDAFDALRTAEQRQFDAELKAEKVAFEIAVLKDKIDNV